MCQYFIASQIIAEISTVAIYSKKSKKRKFFLDLFRYF